MPSGGALLATLQDPGASNHDYFATSVAVSGQTAVVGSPGASGHLGAAYIYIKGPSGWSTTPSVTLSDPDQTTGDNFGDAVAICKTTLVVSGEGAAYIYTEGGSGWSDVPAATLAPPSGASGFGYSLACSGSTVVVGSPTTGGDQNGSAYIYTLGSSGWPTTPTTTLLDPVAQNENYAPNFGYSVAVLKKTLVVGAPGTDDGGTAAMASPTSIKKARQDGEQIQQRPLSIQS